MKKTTLVLVCISLVSIALGWFLNTNVIKKSFWIYNPHYSTQEAINLALKIKSVWFLGDTRFLKIDKKACTSLMTTKIQNKCNPLLLDCLLGEIPKDFTYQNNSTIPLKSKKTKRYLNIAKNELGGMSSYQFTIKSQDKSSHTFTLDDSCHELYLPKRRYNLGQQKKKRKDEWSFDNFSEEIFIDRYQVRNIDYYEFLFWYLNTDKKELLNKPFERMKGLNLSQMRHFCAFKGKRLLPAQFFDAATFLPLDMFKPKKNYFTRGKYPFTKNKKTMFNDSKNSEFKEDYCKFIQTKECRHMPGQLFSWMGILDVLGGNKEAFESDINGENLSLSSTNFEYKSHWHQLGMRVRWDGENDKSSFDTVKGNDLLIKVNKDEVSFRCARFL